ncbi:MAG: N-acetyltransferase [Planctomycetes bacterium]|nr:N-acetyltransferase [Planctomycetota bacterium]
MTSVRPEIPSDAPAIAEVNRLAFGQENEGRLVEAIRRGPGFDPRLSLVAEEEGQVVGHILLSPIGIELRSGGRVPTTPAGRVPTSSLQEGTPPLSNHAVGTDERAADDRSVPAPAAGVHPALALAPMAVRPGFQRRGIGSDLVRAGLDRASALGHRIVIVLGHPEYYPRFGFRPARPLGIEPPFLVRDEVFMALELFPGALDGVRGTVRYPPVFDGV